MYRHCGKIPIAQPQGKAKKFRYDPREQQETKQERRPPTADRVDNGSLGLAKLLPPGTVGRLPACNPSAVLLWNKLLDGSLIFLVLAPYKALK